MVLNEIDRTLAKRKHAMNIQLWYDEKITMNKMNFPTGKNGNGLPIS